MHRSTIRGGLSRPPSPRQSRDEPPPTARHPRGVTFACLCLVTLTLGALAASEARADDPRHTAARLLKDGDKLFQKGEFEEALARYQRAFEVFPSVKIYYPMAQAEENLGRYVQALEHYELLLSEAGEPVPDGLRRETEGRVADLERKIVTIKFAVRPEGTAIAIDGAEIGKAPLEKPVRLLPGKHIWSITKQGFLPVEKEMELDGGMVIDEVIELEVEPVVAVTSGGSDQGGGKRRVSGATRGVLIGGIAVTSALATSSIVVGMMAMAEHDKFSDTTLPVLYREDARKRGKSLARASDILLVSAAIAGGFTIYWYLGQVRPATRGGEARAAARTIVTPYATPDGGGFAILGRF